VSSSEDDSSCSSDEQDAITFEDAIEVPADNYSELLNDANSFNKDLIGISSDDDLINQFQQFLIFARIKYNC
jgi:hypothetical protein